MSVSSRTICSGAETAPMPSTWMFMAAGFISATPPRRRRAPRRARLT
jgi:hypothetical protein